MEGRIHSFETCGTVDGPGIRFVIFMQGCPLRCLYCHNPDTWDIKDGKKVSIEEVVDEVERYSSFLKTSNGGVTLSGGEPFFQPNFVLEICKRLKAEGYHTAIDTSGYVEKKYLENIKDFVDLFLIDLKCIDEKKYKAITGVKLNKTLETIEYLDSQHKEIWIRYVLVPGITDDKDLIDELGKYLSKYKSIKRVEILPFHKMGEHKWKKLGYSYKLFNTESPEKELIDNSKKILKKYGLMVV